MKENFLTSAHGCRDLSWFGSDMKYREPDIRHTTIHRVQTHILQKGHNLCNV